MSNFYNKDKILNNNKKLIKDYKKIKNINLIYIN